MFVNRSTENGEEVVVLRYAAAFYWLLWPTLVVSVVAALRPSSLPISIAAGVAWAILLASAAPYWPVVWEIKKKMRESSISASGSKYSFSNPLTYRWHNSDKSISSD